MINNLRAALQQTAGQNARAAAILPDIFHVYGFIELPDVGDYDVDVGFSVGFVGMPVLTGNGSLAEGEAARNGHFPTFNVTPLSWVYDERPGGSRIYRGARLGIVFTGPPGTAGVACWIAQGTALVNPARPSIEMMI